MTEKKTRRQKVEKLSGETHRQCAQYKDLRGWPKLLSFETKPDCRDMGAKRKARKERGCKHKVRSHWDLRIPRILEGRPKRHAKGAFKSNAQCAVRPGRKNQAGEAG